MIWNCDQCELNLTLSEISMLRDNNKKNRLCYYCL